MRVGFVICGSLELVSGGFLYDRRLIDGLRAAGVQVEVLALPWRGVPGALVENFRRWPQPGGPLDVVVQDELCHPAVFARNRRWRAEGVPVVALVHNLAHPPGAGRSSWRAAIERRYLADLDGVIAVCDATLADVRALAGAPRAAVVARAGGDHLAPGIDEAGAERRSRQPGPLRLLQVATVMRHKGLHRLIEALAPLPGDAFTLDVAGSVQSDPSYVASVERAARQRGLAGRVRLHGELRGQPLWDLYRRSHALLMPSDRESYSLACLEAMAFALPVLVTDRGGMAEMVTPPADGFLLDPDDRAAWTARVRNLAADRAQLAVMARAALARHRRQGTWADTARTVELFLTSLSARSPARGRTAQRAEWGWPEGPQEGEKGGRA
jgi:glycosyltransferase involved in cell wall biosynthesis